MVAGSVYMQLENNYTQWGAVQKEDSKYIATGFAQIQYPVSYPYYPTASVSLATSNAPVIISTAGFNKTTLNLLVHDKSGNRVNEQITWFSIGY